MSSENPNSPLEYTDFTIKATLTNFAPVEEVLISMGAMYIGNDEQTDYYFETDNGKLKLRQGTIENRIAHYRREYEVGSEKTIVFRYEENPSSEAIKQLRSQNKLIGFVRKSRKIYRLDNLKIHLDTLPDNRKFIEIEAFDRTNRFSAAALKAQCMAVKEKLGIPDSVLIKTGYMET
ncbi:MAG: CYTH domain-containing protein [Flammeovirgaceae bacterium]|nr:MAG: CYTH domain-containing protein [Flammeovirgaceae bacterium]